MADSESIGKYIQEIAASSVSNYSVLGYVDSVDEKEMVCTVLAADKSTIYYNVRLKEVSNEEQPESGFWLIPELKSRVIVEFIAPSEAYIIMVSEVSKVHYKVEDIRVGLTNVGFSLHNEKENKDFKTLMDQLLDLLSTKYQVQTAWGPSGFAMQTVVQELDSIKEGFAKILTEGENNVAK